MGKPTGFLEFPRELPRREERALIEPGPVFHAAKHGTEARIERQIVDLVDESARGAETGDDRGAARDVFRGSHQLGFFGTT